MPDRLSYEVVVVGGGPAGMTTALYTTRLGHRTAVFEKEGGRHASVASVHNLLGVSEDVSGSELSKHAVDQFEEYGGDYYLDAVEDVRAPAADDDAQHAEEGDESTPGQFVVEATNATIEADRVVLATGFTDVEPSVPDLRRFTGRGLHYCLHCDAYSLGDSPAFVLGHDEHAANVACMLLQFTADVDLLLDDETPEWDDETDRQLEAHPVDRIDEAVVGAYADDEGAEQPWLGGLTFADGTDRAYRGGFAVYGSEYDADLAESLGCARTDDGAIEADDDGATSVDGVYAVGDVTHGQNQTPVAMGDGALAGIAVHKDLRRFPIDVDELEDDDVPAVPSAPPDLRARMRANRERSRHAGLREPSPDR